MSNEAYNAAIDAEYLRGLLNETAIAILVRENEEHLASIWIAQHYSAAAAQGGLNALVRMRTMQPVTGETWSDPLDEEDPVLEQAIEQAERALEGANAMLRETHQRIRAVADRIIARVPGADMADTAVT